MKHRSTLRFGTATFLVASAWVNPANAQTASTSSTATTVASESSQSPSSTASQEQSGLEDIVVTAQRRSENLQNVPISVAAVTGATLRDRGVVNTESLTISIPGLVITRQALGSTPYLRGVGTQSSVLGGENAVATYVDGVYIADSSATAFSFNNIERVEVLRGPQGTLFGRNATGGLINVITREPSANTAVEGRVSYGSYNTFEGNLYATGGSDRLAADIALYGINQSDGYGKFINIAGQPDATYNKRWAARSKIVWNPGDKDKLSLSLDYAKVYYEPGIARAVLPGSIGITGYVPTGTIYDATGGTPSTFQRDVNYGASLKYERDLGFATLTLLSAYRDSDLRFTYDFDGVPARIVDLSQSQETSSYQNEAYINGQTGRLSYTAGFFIFSSTAKAYPFAFRSIIPSQNSDLFATQESKSYAGYAQGTYEVADRTHLTLGLRYTIDEKSLTGQRLAATGNTITAGTVLQSVGTSVAYRAATWRIALDHKLNEDTLIFASFNRGFKSGTYNLANIVAPPVKPERLDAYEIGLKTEFFDRLVRLNTSAFYYKYSNVQLTTTQVGITSLFNAASSTLKGIDAELTLAPKLAKGTLLFNLGTSILDAKYNNFPAGQINTPNPAGGNIQTLADLSGKDAIHAPKFTLSLATNFTMPVGAVELGLNAGYYHNSGFAWEPDNRLRQSAYDIVNGDVSISFGAYKQYKLSVFAKNLLDTKYYSYVTEGGTGDTGIAAPPRTFGGAFSFKL